MKYTLLVNRCSKSSIETVKQRCPKAIIVNFGEVFPFQTSGVFHIETSHLLGKHDWFLYETQHWAVMG